MGPSLILYAVPFFLITVILEAVLVTREQKDFIDKTDSFTSIALGIGNLLTGLITKGFIWGVYVLLYEKFRIFTLDMSVWWVWVLAFFADDFSYYWFHREAHLIRYFWASHKVHHSSQKYNLATALRQTWTGNLTGSYIFYLWMPLVGFHPIIIVTMQQVSLLYQYWIHTETINKMWKPFEFLFNTPSHHRVHHGSDVKYLDCNYAGILIIWDRMFGTFVKEQERPRYGLTNNLNTHNPVKIAFSEWVDIIRDLGKAGSLKNAFMYIFAPPGWSPDGSTKTAKEMQKELDFMEKNR
ncbi:Sterol desaturase/sphingolipid hydroxylase, fatty acid hydroxylase superfamily [Pseudarcicella hirudinis]|uniref:Sterol desaturase/sphingolipid hydroxylase, fatty acid hydroxylase superfamily n=1 Tax=Pseudarcicella hirudinis TaxID=1079859 RepID=A0A1I5QX15_9BACT|nr:sterol desaturase family protein [Pseudarcicella hirudinis]SFP50809.1 Sterol desaturase/sphingolipid hydroxylase, fatty acid hydroxylase superfamily [Pseudarcicella hirudinis]